MEESSVTSSPLVSVCIANYNGSKIIAGCIDSVLAQDCEFQVEILVHDDASTDDSADIVLRDYPCVRLIRGRHNIGFCASNNRMVAEAQGDYILLLNNDAELFSDALRSLMEETSAIGRVAILSLPQYDYHSGGLIDRGCRLDPFFNPVPNLDLKRHDVAMVIGACMWMPKGLWMEMGGFPEWFGSIAEDMYLCCRARMAGYAVRALDVSGYRHRVGQSFGGGRVSDHQLVSTFRRRALSERNKSFVMVMICPSPFLQLLFPIHLALLFLEGVLLTTVKGRFDYLTKIYLPIYAALCRQSHALVCTRSAIMQNRRLTGHQFFRLFDLLPYKLRMLLKYGLPQLT